MTGKWSTNLEILGVNKRLQIPQYAKKPFGILRYIPVFSGTKIAVSVLNDRIEILNLAEGLSVRLNILFSELC